MAISQTIKDRVKRVQEAAFMREWRSRNNRQEKLIEILWRVAAGCGPSFEDLMKRIIAIKVDEESSQSCVGPTDRIGRLYDWVTNEYPLPDPVQPGIDLLGPQAGETMVYPPLSSQPVLGYESELEAVACKLRKPEPEPAVAPSDDPHWAAVMRDNPVLGDLQWR